MTLDERLLHTLRREVRGMSAAQAVEFLLREELLDARRVEGLLIRREVAARTARGEGKCCAMEAVAEDFCCSYEKVRGIVYRTAQPLKTQMQ